MRRFHRSTAWPFPPRLRREDCTCIPQSFYRAHHFPRTSILLLLKSSKISALRKGAVWAEASLFHKRLLDFLHQRLHFPETPIHHKSSVLAALQLTIVLHLPDRQGCHQRTLLLCSQRWPAASDLQQQLLSVMCGSQALHTCGGRALIKTTSLLEISEFLGMNGLSNHLNICVFISLALPV